MHTVYVPTINYFPMSQTLLYLVLILTSAADTWAQNPAEAYRWEKRVLVFFAEEVQLRQQQALFAPEATACEERDLVLLYLQVGSTQARLWQQYWVLQPGEGLLIGKDGSAKLRQKLPLRPVQVFGLIDQMPMRQQEKRRQKP